MTSAVVLKLSYAGETHRTMVTLYSNNLKDAQGLSYEFVRAKVHETFPKLSSPWTLVYRDDEGDVITLTHALEFEEACRVLLRNSTSSNKKPQSLHFYVLSCVSFREKIVAAVLPKVMELASLAREAAATLYKCELLGKGRDSLVRFAEGAVTQAGVAINHIRNSEILGRGRESFDYSAAQTRTLLTSARSGVSTHLRRASSVVAAGIERRRSSSESSDERGYRPTECRKSPPVAAFSSSPSSEVAVTIDLRQSVSSVASETPLVQTPRNVEESDGDAELPALMSVDVEEQQVPETAYESDADTLCDDDDDREWDIVNESGSTAGNEGIVATSGEWAHALDVLRGILIHVNEEVCCNLLSQYSGNIEAVLVELTNPCKK